MHKEQDENKQEFIINTKHFVWLVSYHAGIRYFCMIYIVCNLYIIYAIKLIRYIFRFCNVVLMKNATTVSVGFFADFTDETIDFITMTSLMC
jgi:hypothetical protein